MERSVFTQTSFRPISTYLLVTRYRVASTVAVVFTESSSSPDLAKLSLSARGGQHSLTGWKVVSPVSVVPIIGCGRTRMDRSGKSASVPEVRRTPSAQFQNAILTDHRTTASFHMQVDERLIIHTPGGGGWGKADEPIPEEPEKEESGITKPFWRAMGSVASYMTAQAEQG